MLEKKILESILVQALKRGGDLAEVFFENTVKNTLSAEDGELEEVRTGFDTGVGIRVQKGATISYAFTDDLGQEALLGTADLVSQALVKGEGISSMDLTRRETPLLHRIRDWPHTVSLSQKASLVLQGDRGAREQGGEIKQVMVNYMDRHQKICVARSDGLLVEDERVYTRMGINAVAAKNGVIQTGMEMVGGFQGMEFFEKNPPHSLGVKAGRMALTMLKARGAPTGQMPVVINNGFGGVLFHEACGHGLEADAVNKEASVYRGQRGKQVAAEMVTAVDDATLPNEWGSYGIDDEGGEPKRTVLIADGVLLDYLYDLREAKKEGHKSTGNGRRQSYRFIPLPRMSNTYIAPGKHKREEIFSAIEWGFYAHQLGGGQVDPATGDFTFSVLEGYLIEKGKVGEPLRGATLIGNGPKALRQIGMVGEDLVISSGICGKDGQSVYASVGQPTILMEGLTVGGTEKKGGE